MKASCPSFVELKGMTFSGQGCMLTMANCPWYSEVSVLNGYDDRLLNMHRSLMLSWRIMRSHVNMNIVVLFFLRIRDSSMMVSGIRGLISTSCILLVL